MKTLTLRGISEELERAIRSAARESNRSINKAAVSLLEQGLGLKSTKYKTYHDLDHLAGTWTTDEHERFHESIKELETIDEDLWK